MSSTWFNIASPWPGPTLVWREEVGGRGPGSTAGLTALQQTVAGMGL